MWGNVGRCGAGMRSARGEPGSCTQCPPARPPPNPQLSVSSLLGCFIRGGVWPHFLHSSTHPPPHGCSPQCLRCGQRGSDPHSDPHPGLCSAPPSPIPLSATTPNPSVPPPTPPQAFKNPNQTPPPPPNSHPRPPFLCFVLLGNVHPFGSAPSTTTPTRSAHGWKRCSRWSPVTPRRGAVPAGPAWPCPGGTHGSWGGYRMVQGFLSLKGFSEAGTPTSSGSLRACCSQ